MDRRLADHDNLVNLLMISALLESRGLVTFLAAHGAEAVALASELRFADLQMPILDSLEATSAIRRVEGECSRLPVLSLPTPARRLVPTSWRRTA